MVLHGKNTVQSAGKTMALLCDSCCNILDADFLFVTQSFIYFIYFWPHCASGKIVNISCRFCQLYVLGVLIEVQEYYFFLVAIFTYM